MVTFKQRTKKLKQEIKERYQELLKEFLSKVGAITCEEKIKLNEGKLERIISLCGLKEDFTSYKNNEIPSKEFFDKCPPVVLYCMYNYKISYLRVHYSQMDKTEREAFTELKNEVCKRDKNIADYVTRLPWHEINIESRMLNNEFLNYVAHLQKVRQDKRDIKLNTPTEQNYSTK